MTDTPLGLATSARPAISTRLVAEGLGTFIIVLSVIGTALFASHLGTNASGVPQGVGVIGVAIAVGFATIAAVYAFGPISGGHYNPAITFAFAAAGRTPWRDVPAYVAAQIVGGAVATTTIVLIGQFAPSGWIGGWMDAGFASNGFGPSGADSFGSPGSFGLGSVIIAEALFAFVLAIVVLRVMHPRHGTPLAGFVVGLTLAALYMMLIPISNASLNPARSIGTAIYGGIGPLSQLWVFLLFPVAGALIAGLVYRALYSTNPSELKSPNRERAPSDRT